MDEVRIGDVVRRLRIRRGLRQVDLAERADVSSGIVRRVERGLLINVGVGAVDRIVRALGGSLDLRIRWHGGDLERVLNARHAAMHEAMARWFRGLRAWTCLPEVSFSVYGERGVIDILAWHAATRTLLVIELKTDLIDVGGLLAQVDRYRRLAPRIAREHGWYPERVAVWVVLAPGRTNARRLAEHRTLLRSVFPDDGRAISGWLLDPSRTLSCLSFLPDRLVVATGRGIDGRRRVDRPRSGAGAVRRNAGISRRREDDGGSGGRRTP